MGPKKTNQPALLPRTERSLEDLLRDTQERCFELEAENDKLRDENNKLREVEESLEYRFGRSLKRQKVPINDEIVDALQCRPRFHDVADLKYLMAPVKGGDQMK